MKRFWLILATLFGLGMTSVPAMADLQYTLDQGGSVGPTPGNYGTVTLHQLGAGTVVDPYHVQVTVQLTAGNLFLTTGSHSGFTWNLLGAINPSSITITSGNASKFVIEPYAAPGSYGNSPFGNFEYAISVKATGGSGGSENLLVFDVKATGGLLLTNTLFSPNANGNFFAADIGTGCQKQSNGKYACAKTGVVAANDPPTQTPEPGTWMLAIAGLTGLSGLMLQRRRKLARA